MKYVENVDKDSLTKVLLVIILVVCIGSFFVKDKHGKPYMSVGKIKHGAAELYSGIKGVFVKDSKTKKKKSRKRFVAKDKGIKPIEPLRYTPYEDREYIVMYKYRDRRGVVHITETKPKNVKYKKLYMPANEEDNSGKDIIERLTGKKIKKTARVRRAKD